MAKRAQTRTKPEARLLRSGGLLLVAVGFLTLVFGYVWLRIEPSLSYERSSPLFFLNRDFFRYHLSRHGGLTDYCGAFLGQADSSNVAGALVFTTLGGLVCILSRQVLLRLHNRVPLFLAFVPLFLLLLMRQRSDGQALTIGLRYLCSLGAVWACWLAPAAPAWLRRCLNSVGSALVYYAAGAWACLHFLLLVALFEFLRSAKPRDALGSLVLGLSAAWLTTLLTNAAPIIIGVPSGHGASWMLAAALFGMLPLTVLISLAVERLQFRKTTPVAVPKRGSQYRATPPPRWFREPVFRRTVVAAFLLGGWVCVWLTFDQRDKALAQMEYYSARGEHQKVVLVAAKLQPLTMAAETRLQLALYHTGRLLSDLFNFTNQTSWNLLPGIKSNQEALRAQCQTLLELGQANEAEHLAHEALEVEGDRPDLLQTLAAINVLKDRPQAARVFLNVLRQIPARQRWAEACLCDLASDPRLTDRVEVARIRSRLANTDLPHDAIPAEAFLQQLLDTNPQNKMAYDYLLTHYLVTRNLDKLLPKLGRLAEFGYAEIPRHCEEAVLLQQRLKGAKVDLSGLKIRTETQRRFQKFWTAVDGGAERSQEELRVLARDFGDTYWFYYLGRTEPGQATDR